MYARRPSHFRTEDLPTVRRWARMLTVVYSLSFVALAAYVLVSHQFARAPLQTADGVQAAPAGVTKTARSER